VKPKDQLIEKLKDKRLKQTKELFKQGRYEKGGSKKKPAPKPPVPLTLSRPEYLKKKEEEFRLEVQRYKEMAEPDYGQTRALQEVQNGYLSRNQAVHKRLGSVRQRVKFGGNGTLVPAPVVISFLSFDALLFAKFLMLSPNWHTSTLQALDDRCNLLENHFVHAYHQHLFYKHAYSTSMPIQFCRQKGIRMDRVIRAEVLKHSQTVGKTIKLGYSYKLAGDPRWLRSDFKLDIVGANKKRLTWVHQDGVNKETYTQPIQPICIGDNVEFGVSLFTL
jgi:hypothetical protein